MSTVHLRFDGRSVDMSFQDLDIGDLSSDNDVKDAVASHLQVPVTKLVNYSVSKAETGDITLRPNAVFGR